MFLVEIISLANCSDFRISQYFDKTEGLFQGNPILLGEHLKHRRFNVVIPIKENVQKLGQNMFNYVM
jgi:hypothetical protein